MKNSNDNSWDRTSVILTVGVAYYSEMLMHIHYCTGRHPTEDKYFYISSLVYFGIDTKQYILSNVDWTVHHCNSR